MQGGGMMTTDEDRVAPQAGERVQREGATLNVLLDPVCAHTRMQLGEFAPQVRAQLQVALAGRLLTKASAGLIEGTPPETVAQLVALGAEVDGVLANLLREKRPHQKVDEDEDQGA